MRPTHRILKIKIGDVKSDNTIYNDLPNNKLWNL